MVLVISGIWAPGTMRPTHTNPPTGRLICDDCIYIKGATLASSHPNWKGEFISYLTWHSKTWLNIIFWFDYGRVNQTTSGDGEMIPPFNNASMVSLIITLWAGDTRRGSWFIGTASPVSMTCCAKVGSTLPGLLGSAAKIPSAFQLSVWVERGLYPSGQYRGHPVVLL
jgi:hypothetical protein